LSGTSAANPAYYHPGLTGHIHFDALQDIVIPQPDVTMLPQIAKEIMLFLL